MELHHLKQHEPPWLAKVSCWGIGAATKGGENDVPPSIDLVIMILADALRNPFVPVSK